MIFLSFHSLSPLQPPPPHRYMVDYSFCIVLKLWELHMQVFLLCMFIFPNPLLLVLQNWCDWGSVFLHCCVLAVCSARNVSMVKSSEWSSALSSKLGKLHHLLLQLFKQRQCSEFVLYFIMYSVRSQSAKGCFGYYLELVSQHGDSHMCAQNFF